MPTLQYRSFDIRLYQLPHYQHIISTVATICNFIIVMMREYIADRVIAKNFPKALATRNDFLLLARGVRTYLMYDPPETAVSGYPFHMNPVLG